MKKEDYLHLILFVALGVMVITGGLLTYEQFQSDGDLGKTAIDNTPQTAVEKGALDTLKYLVNPAYEYTEYCVEEGENPCETLSKTVISVRHTEEDLKTGEVEGLRKYPAKSSINLILKKYSVSRSGSDTYYVTVESFDAFLEGNAEKKGYTDFSTDSDPSKLLRSLESCDIERLIEKNRRDSRPI